MMPPEYALALYQIQGLKGKLVVHLTKIYTKQGDGGKTRLVGGLEVEKDSLRIEAYGTVDELNSIIGLVRVQLDRVSKNTDVTEEFSQWLRQLQNLLFNLGSDLATPFEKRFEGLPVIEETDISALERLMDKLNKDLQPLNSFVLPGGGPVAAFLHQARTVCRRAERAIVTLSREENIGPFVVPYINRLSDSLFVWSRWLAKALGEEELLWEP